MKHQFPCGTRVLDYASTLRARDAEAPFDFLGGPTDLESWFLEAGVRTNGDAVSAAEFEAAIELREAIYTVAWHKLQHETVPSAAVSVIEHHAAQPNVIPTLLDSGIGREGSAQQCLSTLAREAIEVFGGVDAALLRMCSRPECSTIYQDQSRGHRREWCSMQTCGNRAKAAAYRARAREITAATA